MRNRNPSSIASTAGGFTLLELMMAVGIIILLAGILLPVISRARRAAQIDTMKLNLHAIATALEAYKVDFGDYPKNPYAYTDGDSTLAGTGTLATMTARTDPTLAMALVGPGPAGYLVSGANNTWTSSGYAYGDVDGADGAGLRASFQVAYTGAATGSAFTVTFHPPPTFPTFSIAPTFISFGTPVQVKMPLPSNQNYTQYVSVVPLTSVNSQSDDVTLLYQLTGTPTISNASLLVPAGRTYSYLPGDKFKIQYVQGPNDALPLPVLLDSWGEPIMYFPVYNRPGATTGTQYLFGSPGGYYTHTVALTTPAPPSPNQTPSIFWDGPIWWWTPDGGTTWERGNPIGLATTDAAMNADLLVAVQWELGDTSDATSKVTPDDAIDYGETLNLPVPYILISAGPNGIFFDPTQTSNTGMIKFPNPTPAQLSQEIKDWGNVYNIDQ